MTLQEAWREWDTTRHAERQARQTLTQTIRDHRASGMTLAQIATVLGVSRQRVEQLSR